jgi:hypothetical protein
MKKPKRDALKLACILLAALLAAGGAGLWALRSGTAMTRSDEVATHLRDLKNVLDFGGADAAQASFSQDAAGWLGSDGGNLILMDQKGTFLHTLNGNLLDGAKSLRLLVSPYFRGQWDLWNYGDGALALILDGNGQILRRLTMTQNPYNSDEDLASIGRSDPAYAALFPSLNPRLYQAYAEYLEDGLNSFDWDSEVSQGGGWPEYAEMSGDEVPTSVRREPWMERYDVLMALAGGATQADVDAVKRYCEWERDQLRQAGGWCAQMIRSGNGLIALALYENNGATNAAYDAMMMRWQIAGSFAPLWLFGLVVLILMTAFWVLRDARRRDFKPALWGILVLMGNVVALIVYLIVRPADSRCPACGKPVKRSFMVCPMCAAPLRARCTGCGRAQEDAWVCCPYCGQARGEDAGGNAGGNTGENAGGDAGGLRPPDLPQGG